MAFAAVQRKSKGTVATSVAIGSGDGWATPTSGNLLVASANSDSTVTMSGWTSGPSVVDGNGAYVFYKTSAGTESTVTATPSGSADIVLTVCEYSGNTATPFDVSNSSTIASSSGTVTTSTSVTTTADADLIIAVAALHSLPGAVPSAPSWANSFANVLSDYSGATSASTRQCFTFLAELLPAGTAGAYSTSASWTGPALDRQQLIIAFIASAAAPALPPILVMPPRR